MRVLFIASAIYGLEGGLERFNRRLVRALDELRNDSGGRVDVVALSDARADEAAAPAGVNGYGAGGSRVRAVLRFLWLALRHQPRVVIYGYVGFVPLAIFLKVLAPRAVHLLIVHGVEVWREPTTARRWATRHCVDAILSVSDFTVRQMSGFFGVQRGAFRVFPNGLDYEPRLKENGAGAASLAGSHRLLSVSRLTPANSYKNIDKVILALPRVLEAFPDTHYYIIGDGPWKRELERLADETGIAPRVHFLGAVAEPLRDAVYCASDVFVLPSTGEGFGIVFLEAWNFGLPCISSNRDAASEVIRDGVDGYCVDPEPDRITEAICALLADPERRKAMGEAGRERLRTNYTHEKFRENLRTVLGEFI
jgi:glycosyltransferase involved in cell wall biosynthesis